MTRVDFYISPNLALKMRVQLACRIAEKAYQTQHRVYLHVASPEQANELDTLLWVFRPGSFVPHCLGDAPHAAATPVLIGNELPPPQAGDVLINLSDQVPGFFSRFARVAEIICGDEPSRQKGRERYKFYRERGYPLESHTLAD
ncbi:MAG: DNA polymerase III subunit chi [Gammaproteobacteria bacterium]|nr:DNA polymerase III subunit chi [Gammaproteobacteria bacterium]